MTTTPSAISSSRGHCATTRPGFLPLNNLHDGLRDDANRRLHLRFPSAARDERGEGGNDQQLADAEHPHHNKLQFEGLLRDDPNDGRPLIGLGEIAGVKAVYRGERRISMRQMTAGAETTGRSERARKRHSGERLAVEAADAPLFEALRAWRRERAAEQRVPPYVSRLPCAL